MKDHIVLLEAPQSEMVTTSIIAEVKKAIPNKPIKFVVNTHTHSDHSGGLRAAAAEGAIIITHESNKPLYEKWFSESSHSTDARQAVPVGEEGEVSIHR